MIEDIFSKVIAPGVTAVLAWFLAKRRYIAEVNTNELDNVEKSIAIYREMVEDLGARVDLLSKGLKELHAENEALLNENKGLKRKLSSMDREIRKLKSINEDKDKK